MSKEKIGSIKDHTPNYKLIIPRFDLATWHDYIEENFRNIDALFFNLFGINNYSGSWKQITEYKQGQVLFIGEDLDINGNITDFSGRLVKVLVDHITDNSDYFNIFYNLHPEYYELFADASTAQIYAQQAQNYKNETKILKNETNIIKEETNSIKNDTDSIKSEVITKQNEINDTISSYNDYLSVKTEEFTQQINDSKAFIEQNITISTDNVEKSRIWAEGEQSKVELLGGELSSKDWSLQARTSAKNAKVSETNAKTSETNAANSEIQAVNALETLITTATDNFNANAEAKKAEIEAITERASFGNIGDIKYTSRTDVPNGGAWCDGSLYTKVQFPDVYQMLVDDKLQSTTITNFDNKVSVNGSCGFFGLDTANECFKVPMLKDVYLEAGQAPSMFGAESLPNITGKITGLLNHPVFQSTGSFISTELADSHVSGYEVGTGNYAEKIQDTAFNASRSSSAYQNGAKVNPDHVVYRAYIVLYASVAESSSVIKDYEIYNTVPLLTPLFHPEEISDTNWLKSEGQWNSGNIYEAVYNELTSDYEQGTDKTDKIDGITISYRLTPKKRRICLADQDANVTALFEATGIAWYYVLDNSLSQFKLPRSKYAFVGYRDNVGGYVAESLPNTTGDQNSSAYVSGTNARGAFRSIATGGHLASTYASEEGSLHDKFDEIQSSSVYQDGAAVQQRSVEAYLYFKVGNATVNAQFVNVGNITKVLADKADNSAVVHKDLDEVITGRKLISNDGNTKYIVGSAGSQLDIYCLNIDSTVVPSSNLYGGITLCDKNGIRMGKMEVSQSTAGNIIAALGTSRRIDDSYKHKALKVCIDQSGIGWIENLRPNYVALVGLDMTLEKTKTMPADGVLFINVQVGSQSDSTVSIHDGSGHPIGVVRHNGGSAERNCSTFTAIVAKGQSINCTHNNQGNAAIVSSYLAPWG